MGITGFIFVLASITLTGAPAPSPAPALEAQHPHQTVSIPAAHSHFYVQEASERAMLADLNAVRKTHGLPPLDPAHMPRRDSPDPKQAKFVAFMEDEVVPRFTHMTEDPTVSCFTCHPKAGDK